MNFESYRGCRICWFAMAVGLMSHVLVIPKSHADEIVIDDNAFTDSFVRILSNLEDSRVSEEIFSNPIHSPGAPFLLATNGGADVVVAAFMLPEITMSRFAPSFNFCRSWTFCVGMVFYSFSFFCSMSAKKACITSQRASMAVS